VLKYHVIVYIIFQIRIDVPKYHVMGQVEGKGKIIKDKKKKNQNLLSLFLLEG